jgi:multiple sugar transport system permease protein
MPKLKINQVVLQNNITGYLFVSPALVIIFIFGLFPIGNAVWMSLYRWRVRQGGFVGIKNYADVVGDWWGALAFCVGLTVLMLAYYVWNNAFNRLSERRWVAQLASAVVLIGTAFGLIAFGWTRMMQVGDVDYLHGLIYTVYYAFGTVPIQLALGLLLSYILYQNLFAKEWYRMIYFVPYITPVVASAVVFRQVFSSRESSIANQVVGLFGIEPLSWIAESESLINILFNLNLEGFWAGPSLAMVSVILFNIWTYTGYYTVVFLAGLGSIPGDLYEAAKVDGANDWHLFRRITLPLLSPVTFYLSVLGFIGTFKSFDSIYVMRDRFAKGTTDTASIVIFDSFRTDNNWSYAAAQAIILLLIILALTAVQRNVFERRVFYG